MKIKFSSRSQHPCYVQAGPRAIFLAPTRELAAQIHREVERLSQGKKLKVAMLSKALAATAAGRWVITIVCAMNLLPLSIVDTLSMMDDDGLIVKSSGGKEVLGSYDIIVATPMRLVAVLREGNISLTSVQVGNSANCCVLLGLMESTLAISLHHPAVVVALEA